MEISHDVLLKAYRTMKTIREFESRIAREFEAGTVPGFTHLYLGQEAVATGVCAHLTDKDAISSTHRGHGHCIAKGCDVREMMLELYCKRDGICKGKGGSMHIADISSSAPIAPSPEPMSSTCPSCMSPGNAWAAASHVRPGL